MNVLDEIMLQQGKGRDSVSGFANKNVNQRVDVANESGWQSLSPASKFLLGAGALAIVGIVLYSAIDSNSAKVLKVSGGKYYDLFEAV